MTTKNEGGFLIDREDEPKIIRAAKICGDRLLSIYGEFLLLEAENNRIKNGKNSKGKIQQDGSARTISPIGD